MKFSYNWLQSFFEKKLPKPEKLAELLTMHSFEVEEVLRMSSDYILDIDILPNRAHDCLSHFGIAREIAALLKFPPKADQPLAGKIQNKKLLDVKIQNKELCPRYTARIIEGIKITESPDWIKERLASMNQKSINNVVDVTNYIMWELGQPLHAFDFNKIEGAKIIIRESRGSENLETLDGEIHDLGEGTIIIEDEKRIIDLAGIKGGANTQIDNNTTTIIFQAAIFDPSHIRRAVQKLGVSTDAAMRYIHGFDPELPLKSLDRAVALLKETNPEITIAQRIDIFPNPPKTKTITVDTRYANGLLGTDISKKSMEQILERLGFGMPSLARGFRLGDIGPQFRITVPSHRLDINIREDVIEEIGRIYGYQNIAADSPRGILISPRPNEQIFWRTKARDILSGFGFSEVYNYSMIPGDKEIELANPISEEFKYLRPALWHGILKNISVNSRHFDSIKIFEIGKVFSRGKSDIFENENCIFALSINREPEGGEGFYRIKGYMDEFFKKLGIADFYFDPSLGKDEEKRFGFLHSGRRANIIVSGEKCGAIGEAHPNTRAFYDIKNRVYLSEIDFGYIQGVAEEEHIYQKPSKYPEIVRDIAILVPRETMVVEVLNDINSVSGPLLRDVDLFDMFEGENLPDGVKNFAFHLIFQSNERTLTSEEVNEIISKITKVLEEKLWEVR